MKKYHKQDPKPWNTTKLINLWKTFWTSKRHLQVANHSLINDDQSLLFVNSGVAALKPYFLFEKKALGPRLFNVQDVIRTNDITKIGKTNRHLTFFQMLGNFSLNDYQKKAALTWGWEFLTHQKWLNLSQDKIYVTFFKEDNEAKEILLSLGIKKTHLILGDRKSNFWDLGVGPCGTNVEFFYDLGPSMDLENKGVTLLQENIDNDRYLEIWNIVFSYQLHLGKGKYVSSKYKNIDTGAGLERLLTVLNNQKSVFMLEKYQIIFQKLNIKQDIKEKLFKITKLTDIEKEIKTSALVICDHLYTILYTLNALIQKEASIDFSRKHGSIINKLIRNASLHGYLLDYKQPFLYKLLELIFLNKSFEKRCNKTFASLVIPQIRAEVLKVENLFWMMVEREKQFFYIHDKNIVLSSHNIFDAVTSRGVPDLIFKKICYQSGDLKPFNDFLKLWKEHLKKSRKGKFVYLDSWELMQGKDQKATIFKSDVTKLNNIEIDTIFFNHQKVTRVDNLSKRQDDVWIIFKETLFFAEKGGQVSDRGEIYLGNKKVGDIKDVKLNKFLQVLHHVKICAPFTLQDHLTLSLDWERRSKVSNNHSGTHLLHSCLIKKLQPRSQLKVRQYGSLNNQFYLRLDVLVGLTSIPLDVIEKVEDEVNALILQKITPKILWKSSDDAEKMGALSFFDAEKFSQNKKVRIVKFANHSIELCGGTHVENTKKIEKFLIYKVKKIAKNIFRFYAYTTKQKINHFWENNTANINEIANDIPIIKMLEKNPQASKTWKEIKALKEKQQHFLKFKLLENQLRRHIFTIRKNLSHHSTKDYFLKPESFDEINIDACDTPIKTAFCCLDLKKVSKSQQMKVFWNVFDNALNKNAHFVFLCAETKVNQLFFVLDYQWFFDFVCLFETTINKEIINEKYNLNQEDLQSFEIKINNHFSSSLITSLKFHQDSKRSCRYYGNLKTSKEINHFEITIFLKEILHNFLKKKDY